MRIRPLTFAEARGRIQRIDSRRPQKTPRRSRTNRRSAPAAPARTLTYVDDDRGLAKLAEHLRKQSAIAVDTEANPMFAYRERLCLIQISTTKRDYIVDPLVGLDLGVLASVFADASIAKILHGAEFDVLQLKRAWPYEIRGMFDTRVAAASLGHESPSLAAMLERQLGVEVDKSHQRSDWGKRPLTDGQLEYARDDTRYLIELADLLRAELHEAGSPHVEEVASECRRVEALIPDPVVVDPDDWVRLKGASALDPVGKRVLRDLNRYRHRLAEERDKPLFKVLGNDALVSIARAKPASMDSLRKAKLLSPKLASRHGRELVEIVSRAKQKGGLRRVPSGRRNPEDELKGDQRVIYDAIRGFRKRVANRRKTDASLVLNRQLMVDLARARPVLNSVERLQASKLLEPWRIAAYADDLAAAIAGAE